MSVASTTMDRREVDQIRPVLITGASGFLGEHLLRSFLGRESHAVGTFRSKPVFQLANSLAQVELCDASAVNDLVAALQPRAAIHCAAATDVLYCHNHPGQAWRANVLATRNLTTAMRSLAPNAPLIHVSTDLVYDGTKPPYGVESVPNPVSTYGLSKLQSERIALDHPGAAVVRAALMFGRPATHKSSFLGWMVETLRACKSLTLFEDEFRTPVFVDDLVAGLTQAVELRLTGLWVAGGPQRLSRFAMGELVADSFGLDKSLLVRSRLADGVYPVARPPDVSIASTDFWRATDCKPLAFGRAIERVRIAANALKRD